MKGLEPIPALAATVNRTIFTLHYYTQVRICTLQLSLHEGLIDNFPSRFRSASTYSATELNYNKFNHCADFMTTLIFQPFGKWSLIKFLLNIEYRNRTYVSRVRGFNYRNPDQ